MLEVLLRIEGFGYLTQLQLHNYACRRRRDMKRMEQRRQAQGGGNQVHGAGDQVQGAGDQVRGAGDQVQGAGDQVQGATQLRQRAGHPAQGIRQNT